MRVGYKREMRVKLVLLAQSPREMPVKLVLLAPPAREMPVKPRWLCPQRRNPIQQQHNPTPQPRGVPRKPCPGLVRGYEAG